VFLWFFQASKGYHHKVCDRRSIAQGWEIVFRGLGIFWTNHICLDLRIVLSRFFLILFPGEKTQGGSMIRREELQRFEGEFVYATAIRGRVSYAIEKISQPKVVILDIHIMDTDIILDHCWVPYGKNLYTVRRKQLISFRARVRKYQSIDEKGNPVEKYGFVKLNRVTIKKIATTYPKGSRKEGKIHERNEEGSEGKRAWPDHFLL
jgi:hypothetical protein